MLATYVSIVARAEFTLAGKGGRRERYEAMERGVVDHLDYLEPLGLNEFDAYQSWKDFHDGALLQLRANEDSAPWIGMKVSDSCAEQSMLRLDKARFCNRISARTLGNASALDVSAKVEFIVLAPAMIEAPASFRTGSIFLHEDGAMFIVTQGEECACVRPSKNFSIGSIHKRTRFQLSQLKMVGKGAIRAAASNRAPPVSRNDAQEQFAIDEIIKTAQEGKF